MNKRANLKVGMLFFVFLAGLAPSDALGGTIVGWGYNVHGQCDVPDGNDFVAVAAGWHHSLALKADGSLVAWGLNDDGQCDVPEGNDFVAIAAGHRYCLALKNDGSIVGWGYNAVGQTDVPSGNTFVAIAGGEWESVALKDNGAIVIWGHPPEELDPPEPPPGNDFVAVASGYIHLALKSSGSVIGWYNDGSPINDLPTDTDIIAMSPCYNHALFLKSNGSIIGWGSNAKGQLDIPAGNDFVGIAAGSWHSIALKSDGTIVGWGNNDYGQIAVPGGDEFVAIAAGGFHNLALTETGPRELTLMDPNGLESLLAGRIYTINWLSTGSINKVLIEYSTNNAANWNPVVPLNAGNGGRYNWLVPQVTSNQCLVRITDANDPVVSDTSYANFTIYECALSYDLNGDCFTDLFDFSLLASEWLKCGNPFDPNCVQ